MKKITFSILLIAIVASLSCTAQKKESENKKTFPTGKYSIKEVLKIGNDDFDPWNKTRWASWYNEVGELIRPFDIDTSIKFKSRKDPWIIEYSSHFEYNAFLNISKQGITVDGNGVLFDVRTEKQKLPLDSLFELKKIPWDEGCEIIGIFYALPEIKETNPTYIENFTFKGLKRGIKINGTGDQEQHRLIVRKCTFTRNRIGFYTNGYNTLLKDCRLFENGYGAIYSGSKSRRNQFINNYFRDNNLSQHQHSYGDFIGDTFFDSEISNNDFDNSQIKDDSRRIGISIFRNMGESNRLRPQMPHNNIIRSNRFYGYSVAINVGGRMGRDTRNDITDEGRDYAFYNLIDSNYIENSTIGIKINTEGNTIKHNTFINVKEDIVLHCVFFKLKNTTINYQKNDEVKLWYTIDDYAQYSTWFKFQDDLNGFIKKEEKLISVFSVVESPDLPMDTEDIFVLNPEIVNAGNKFDDHRMGSPKTTDAGEFSLDLPGDETIAIWDQPISRIGDVDYYSILFFDNKGTEINRCGRSETKWKQIAAGYFVRKDGEMEVAAVMASPIDGKYPVYIFDRGFRIPKEVHYENNTNPKITISSNKKHELMVEFQ